MTTIAIAVVALFGALLVLILIIAFAAPDTFRVQRAVSIKAPPEKIFALIANFRDWVSWSPYEKLDPAMKRTYSGATKGNGAVYAWDGKGKAGAGRMEITDTSSPSQVTIKIDFIKPFENHNIAEFTLESKGGFTNVTWAMHGPNPFIARVMHLIFNIDRMIGTDFEIGLANLKAATET
ncbi:SRPBCC family protein [Mesorhizobium sophorae]|uniref:SRPBCC family protein n=1 Tax=Mesorhizobium sophorae TaxID=1300294 RepID=UPI000BA35322|nr:SRPBCC family protein [Mesorhizobium sophorae]